MAEYAIRAEGLAKSFKRTQALRGIDLAVPPGTVCALLGVTAQARRRPCAS